jgi:hypothetical protein
MKLETVDINKINPAPYNPRKDLKPGDSEYEKLKKSITEFDMVEPLILNKRGNVLIGGHQRLKVLKEMGRKEVEVSVVDLPPAKEKALNLALNKISGEWDLPLLKDLLQEIDTGEFDIEITGFDSKEIEDLINQLHVDKPPYTGIEQTGDDDSFLTQFGFANNSVWIDINPQDAVVWEHLIHPPANNTKSRTDVKYNYSRANPVAIERIIKLWMQPGDFYYEPCCGWCTFSASAKYFGYNGVALDNWDYAVKFSKKTINVMPGEGTCEVLLNDAGAPPFPDNHFDFIHMNPPFGNLEEYSGESAGCGSYDNWLSNMGDIQRQNYRVLKDDTFCVVVMADWREDRILKNGHGDMIKLSEDCGFILHDLIICRLHTVAMFFSRKCYEQRHAVKGHEYILVFRKGDPVSKLQTRKTAVLQTAP